MAPKEKGLVASNLEERTRRNLDRITGQLGMTVEDFRTVVLRETEAGLSSRAK